jgi:hypothetical protein
MAKGIGRLLQLGVAKESIRGTAISSATYWVPSDEISIDEKFDNAQADQAVGVIEDSIGEYRVKNEADGSFKMPMLDQSTGLLFLSMLGSQTVGTHSGESVVYDHTFSVGESAQHQSLTLFIHDPLSGVDYSHANGVIHKMDIDASLKKFVQLSLSARAQKGVVQSSFTPSILAENRFIPQYMTFSYAPTTAGVNGTLTATGTASTTIHVTALSISTTLLNVGMRVTATNLPAGATIAKIVSATAFDLSVATTGAVGTMTFNGAIVALKNFKLSMDSNIEDQEVLGNVAPADFLNKEFKVSGSLEAIWQNESDFKTVALATPNVGQAVLVDMKNTDVVIGSTTNPELKITLDQVFFTEFGRPIKVKDLVYQTVKFRCTYSLANSELMKILLTNTVSGTYA